MIYTAADFTLMPPLIQSMRSRWYRFLLWHGGKCYPWTLGVVRYGVSNIDLRRNTPYSMTPYSLHRRGFEVGDGEVILFT
jgi:hypothetical protein